MITQIGFCQIPILRSWAELSPYLREAADKARENALILLPELFWGGFDYPDRRALARETPDLLESLAGFCRANRLYLAGTFWREKNGALYNAMRLVGPDLDAPLPLHAKAHLFPLSDEEKYFAPGPGPLGPHSIGGLNLGTAICFELRFPEIFRIQAEKGVDCFLLSSQWPAVRAKHLDILCQARAVENQCFVLSANGCGPSPYGDLAGRSRLVSPWGQTLLELGSEPGVALLDYDPRLLEKARTPFNSRISPLHRVGERDKP